MSEWIVYSKDGNTERCRLKALEYSGTWMGERAVTATFEYHSEVAFEVFDYLEYRGEVFELDAVPTVKKTSSFDYSYDLRFVSKKYELERCEMRDLVPNDNGVVYPTPLTFSFTGDVRYLVERIQACLDALYGEGVWSIVVADGVESEEKNITLAQQNCWNALALVNTTYGLNFYVKGREVVIGGTQPVVSHTFEYGKGNGLYEIERSADTDKGIVTKLRAYGGTRNLDYSYPKQPEWSDSALSVSFALSPLRLMLPSFKADGKTDFVLADDATIAKYGIREASMVYDDIYPTITGATNSSGEAIDEIKSVDAVDDSASTFTVYLYDLGFDLEEHLTTSEAQLSMKSGPLQGYTFNISSIEKQSDGGYKLVLGRNSLEGSEESGFYVPNADWNMSAGDKFVLLNILMPQAYIREAEERLLARAKEYLAQYGKTNFSYNIGLHDKFLVEHGSVYGSLLEGSKLSVRDAEIGIDEDVTIQSITITENMEENILPQVKVTLNNEPSASTLDRIQGKLNDIANETAANNFSSQSELMAQYRKKLDKPFFDKLFVAIDADGNEIASNDVTTPVAYIKALYDVAVVGGVTMYVNDKSLDIPSIYAGLPIDTSTLRWIETTDSDGTVTRLLGINPDIDLGGGAATWDELEGKPSWIGNTKPSYNYSEILQTPDLSVYALASDLAKYVTLADNETITGLKNFTKGIQIDGLGITKSQDDVIYLDANLVVRGGITMYAEGTVDVGTIFDALPIDDSTIYWEGGVLKANITEGVITNITSAMVVEALGYTPYNASNPKGYISGITSDMVTTALGYTPLQNHQTIYALTIQKNGTTVGTYTPNSAKKTINIVVPTKVSELSNDSEYATTSDLDTRISDLINGAPAAYDTLKEIADVLEGNINSIGDIITTLGTKADKATKISAGTGLSGGGTLEADRTLSLATSGVSAGTYKSVTVDKYGRVTSGTNPTTLAGYGITDAYTKTNVDDLLKLYVTLATAQTITGEKDFTGGLKVNGSPIVYDATNKYWKLEGDLLVTGGVTMYGSDSEFKPSTIMDGVTVDNVTIKKNADGALYFAGSVDGGVASSVDWENITSKPTFATVATSGKYSDLTGLPDLTVYAKATDLSSYQTKITSTNKLAYSLISGTPTSLKNPNALSIKNSSGTEQVSYDGSEVKSLTLTKAMVGLGNVENTALSSWAGTSKITTLGTISSGTWNGTKIANDYLANSSLTISGTSVSLGGSITQAALRTALGLGSNAYTSTEYLPASSYTASDILTKLKTVDGAGSGLDADTLDGLQPSELNVGSASKLQTARTIWGQSFDGTGNVSGALSGATTGAFSSNVTIGGTLGITGAATLKSTLSVASDTTLATKLTLNGIPIYKSQDDVLYIDGNLAVRGGITMYATDAIDVDDIIANLPIASTSEKGIASFNPNDFSVVDGYVSFIGSGGVDESVLADYAKKTDLSAYLPLSGGQMTGNIGYTLDPDSYGVGLPAAGSFEYVSPMYERVTTKKSFIGSAWNTATGVWWNLISVRHRNGAADGSKYGMYITSALTAAGDLQWNKQINGSWQGERVILDSVNWSQYIDTGSVGAYLPLGGGALGGTLGLNQVDGQGIGISLYGGTGFVQNYGIWFGVTSAWGTHGVMTGDWATYFGMDGGSSRGWVFRHVANGNVASITGNGDVCANSWFRSQGDCGWHNDRYGGGIWMRDNEIIRTYGGKILYIEEGGIAASNVYGIGGHTLHLLIGGVGAPHSSILLRSNTCGWGIAANANGNMYVGRRPSTSHLTPSGDSYILELSLSGLLCYGGITVYSDIRKKTKLQDVELTLQQIADAPLIEHYYNSDAQRTTHVGSIAQYWAGLNDWFCKLDNEGYYTMEIQNAALASAISIARHLQKYESKTDRTIRKLKQRVSELEEEMERLKSA